MLLLLLSIQLKRRSKTDTAIAPTSVVQEGTGLKPQFGDALRSAVRMFSIVVDSQQDVFATEQIDCFVIVKPFHKPCAITPCKFRLHVKG
jgi:hypothetical protein